MRDDVDWMTASRLRSLSSADWAELLAGPPHEVARWVGAAARHGFRSAQVLWGQMLLDGHGVERDPSAALHWFNRAAQLGSLDGINMVGRSYELAWGVPADHARAMACYRKAADRGSAWGQYNLASLLLYGEGIERDPRRALEWYHRSARQGHAKAMGMIGRFHEEGWTVPADLAQALAWYLEAARGGDFWGQYNTARLLAAVGKSDEALLWLDQAIHGGTHNFLRSIAPDLMGHPDPAFRAAGLKASLRCRERDVVSFQRAYAAGVPAEGQDPDRRQAIWRGLHRVAGRCWRIGYRPARQASRAAAVVLGVSFALAPVPDAAAQDLAVPPLRIELNRLESIPNESCRTYLRIDNQKGRTYRSLKLDLFALDQDGVAAKRLAVELGPIADGKTQIKLFDLTGLPCARVGEVLVNDVLTCETATGPLENCVAQLETRSRVGSVPLAK